MYLAQAALLPTQAKQLEWATSLWVSSHQLQFKVYGARYLFIARRRTATVKAKTDIAFIAKGKPINHIKSCLIMNWGQGIPVHGKPRMKIILSKSPCPPPKPPCFRNRTADAAAMTTANNNATLIPLVFISRLPLSPWNFYLFFNLR